MHGEQRRVRKFCLFLGILVLLRKGLIKGGPDCISSMLKGTPSRPTGKCMELCSHVAESEGAALTCPRP